MTFTKSILAGFFVAVAMFVALTAGFSVAFADWTEPSLPPPGGNLSPFVASLFEVLSTNSDATPFEGDVIVGDVANAANLHVDGGEISSKWIHATEVGENTMAGNLKVGSGVTTARLDIDGAIKIDTTTVDLPGTIRWTGIDFEGYLDGQWVSLTE